LKSRLNRVMKLNYTTSLILNDEIKKIK